MRSGNDGLLALQLPGEFHHLLLIAITGVVDGTRDVGIVPPLLIPHVRGQPSVTRPERNQLRRRYTRHPISVGWPPPAEDIAAADLVSPVKKRESRWEVADADLDLAHICIIYGLEIILNSWPHVSWTLPVMAIWRWLIQVAEKSGADNILNFTLYQQVQRKTYIALCQGFI